MGGRPRELDQALVPTTPKRFVTLGVAKPRENARLALKRLVGPNGEALWDTIFAISKGETWVPKLADGRVGPPQIPSTDDRLAAAKFLAEFLYGKAVAQTDIVKAEQAASQATALEDLSDADLLMEAKEAILELQNAPAALPPREDDE